MYGTIEAATIAAGGVGKTIYYNFAGGSFASTGTTPAGFNLVNADNTLSPILQGFLNWTI